MNEQNKISYRFSEVRKALGFSQGDFARKLSTTQGNISNMESGRREIPVETIIFLNEMFFISTEWLLTGKGSMKVLKISSQNGGNIPVVGVPLIPTEAFAGWGGGNVQIAEHEISERYVIPDFKDAEFVLRIKGSSMYPKYSSGDVVACRRVNERKFIQWNKVYVLHTSSQGVLIKRIKKSEDPNYIICISENKEYDPFEVPLEDITDLALVVGVIRSE